MHHLDVMQVRTDASEQAQVIQQDLLLLQDFLGLAHLHNLVGLFEDGGSAKIKSEVRGCAERVE
jgi:hypothetical protein